MKKKKIGFTLLAALLPLLFFVVVEGGLRLAGVGEEEQHLFVELPGKPDYVAMNPRYVPRYFNGFRPGIAYNPFRKEKQPGSFRVFVLGGSSAAGFPYPFYYGFPAQLSTMLETAAPDQSVEVINLGLTAVNSYTLWDIRKAVLAKSPDAVVIYAGHNEYYGAFGAGSSINSLGNSLLLKRLVLRLKTLVLYRWMEGLLRRSPDQAGQPGADRTLMAQVVRDATIDFGSKTYLAGIEQFKSNIDDVIALFAEEGIPVYVGTLTSNLRDQAPLGDNAESARKFQEGVQLLSNGASESRDAFLKAKETDNIRFRAPEAINDVLREAAEKESVIPVDVQSAIMNASATRIEGADLFTDHLHPNRDGYEKIARVYFDELVKHPSLRVRNTAIAKPDDLDPIGQAHAEIQIARLKGGYPFNKTATGQEQASSLARLLMERSASELGDSLAVTVIRNPETMSQALLVAARTARSASDTTNALLYYRAILNWQPFNDRIIDEAIAFGVQSANHDEAVGNILQFVVSRHESIDRINALAAIRLRQGRLDEAAALLGLVEKQDPQSRTMAFNMARLLVLRGDTLEARRYFNLSQGRSPDPR